MLTVRPHTSLDPELLAAIVREQGTPTYVYDARILDAGVRRWIEAVGNPLHICYAVKANYNLGVLARLAAHGIGFEASTVGEMARGGIVLNFVGAGVIASVVFTVGTVVFDIDPTVLPAWAESMAGGVEG